MFFLTFESVGVAKEELEDAIVKKLRQCRALFDFTKSLSDVGQKDIKRDCLLELVDFFVTERGFLTPQIYKEVFDMVHDLYSLFSASNCLLLDFRQPISSLASTREPVRSRVRSRRR